MIDNCEHEGLEWTCNKGETMNVGFKKNRFQTVGCIGLLQTTLKGDTRDLCREHFETEGNECWKVAVRFVANGKLANHKEVTLCCASVKALGSLEEVDAKTMRSLFGNDLLKTIGL